MDFVDHSIREGFVRPEHRRMIAVADDASVLLETMAGYAPPAVEKWIDRDAT